MKDRKTEFRFFTVPQWEAEQDYLRKRHQEGWRFTSVTFPGFYHFEKCEPEDVIYQLDYNQEGIAHKDEYVQMFRDCGWEYLMDFVGYSYFRKPVSEMAAEENIFCDDDSRIDMIKRVFRGRMLPMIVIFFACILPQLVMNGSREGGFFDVMFWLFLLLLILYVAAFVQFGRHFWKLLKSKNDD